MSMRRATLFVLVAGTAACGGFLGFGDDDDEVPPAPSPSDDASIDAPTTSDASGASDAPSTPDVVVDATKDSAGCNAPPCERFVFATSAIYTANLGGRVGADAKCMERASVPSADARLKGRTFIAYLSVTIGGGDFHARDRLRENGPPFKRLDGQVVAETTADFVAGPLKVAINRDESNTSVTGNVWTGSLVGGLYSDQDCNAWSEESSIGQGTVGSATASDNPNWINAGPVNCVESRRLYCVED